MKSARNKKLNPFLISDNPPFEMLYPKKEKMAGGGVAAKPAHLMTLEEYQETVTPILQEYNKFIRKNEEYLAKVDYNGIFYYTFEEVVGDFKSGKTIGSHFRRGAYDKFLSDEQVVRKNWAYRKVNRFDENFIPAKTPDGLAKKKNEYIDKLRKFFSDDEIYSRIEKDEVKSNKRSVKRAIDDGTYKKLLEEEKVVVGELEKISSSVGVKLPKKIFSESDIKSQETEDLYEKIYRSLPRANKDVLMKFIKDVKEGFEPLEKLIYEHETKRFNDDIKEALAAKEIEDVVLVRNFSYDTPFWYKIFHIGNERKEKIKLGVDKYNREQFDTRTYYSDLKLIHGYKEVIHNQIIAHIESLKVHLLSAFTEHFVKLTKPMSGFEQLNLEVGKKGFEGTYKFNFEDGSNFIMNTEAVGAGGYNIQRYHFRYLVHFRSATLADGTILRDLGKLQILQHFATAESIELSNPYTAVRKSDSASGIIDSIYNYLIDKKPYGITHIKKGDIHPEKSGGGAFISANTRKIGKYHSALYLYSKDGLEKNKEDAIKFMKMLRIPEKGMGAGGIAPDDIKTLLDHLYKEHHEAFDACGVICEAATRSPEEATRIISRMWESELEHHFKEEEEVIFPKLLSISPELEPEINSIIREHARFERMISELISKPSSETAKSFCLLLQNHIVKEERLFKVIMPDPYKCDKDIVYVDLDDTLVDERSGIEQGGDPSEKGFYAGLKPIAGGIEAVRKLAEHYDVRILSAPSTNNPDAWTEKVLWVKKYFGDLFEGKVILSPDKSLLEGKYLIDNSLENAGFKGEFIHFGSDEYPSWDAVIGELISSEVSMEAGGKINLKNTKVVDSKGKPLVVYHGSQNPNLDKFRESAYFADNIKTAKSFADRSFMGEELIKGEVPTLYYAHLNLENPKIITTEEEYEKYFQDITPEEHERIKSQHDGMIYYPEGEGDNYYLVFDPNKIQVIKKEVLGNRMEAGGVAADKQLLAPNGNPSNLTPEQHELVRTPAFKKWFGDWEKNPKKSSKVVDENGEPLALYHSSDNKFSVFRTSSELGAHFGTKLQAADVGFREGRSNFMYVVFLNIRNPIRLVDDGEFRATTLSEKLLRDGLIDKSLNSDLHSLEMNDEWAEAIKEVQEAAKSKGIDGVVYINRREGVNHNEEEDYSHDYESISDEEKDLEFTKFHPEAKDSWIVFNPEQIKLADGSNIKFNPKSPDIRKEKGGDIEPDSFEGKEAAGALIVAKNTGRVLLLLRNEDSGEPSTWAGAGGKVEEGESVEQALHRELQEEIGVSGIEVYLSYIFERKNFTFHNFIGIVDEEFVPELNEEHLRYKWANVNNLPTPLHFGFREFLNNIDIKSEIQEIKSERIILGKGGLLAPNGRPSNLNAKQYELVRTPEFKKWFGDWQLFERAKALEENIKGVYKSVFKDNPEQVLFEIAVQANSGYTQHDAAIKMVGKEFVGLALKLYPEVKVGDSFYPVISKVVDENGEPLIVYHGTNKSFSIFDETKISFFAKNKDEASSYGDNIIEVFLSIKNPFDFDKSDFDTTNLLFPHHTWIKELSDSGHDGIIGTNLSSVTDDEEKYYLAFLSTQIKLADGTNTTFDPNNPDIRHGAGGKTDKILSKKETAQYLKSQFKDYQKVNMPAVEIRKLSRKAGKRAQAEWLKSPEFKEAYKRYEKDFEGERERNPDEKIDWNGLEHLMVADSREQDRLERLNKYRTGGVDALPIFVRAGLPPKVKGKYVASTGHRSIMGVPTGQEWKESGVSVFDAEYFGKKDFIVVDTGASDSLTIAFNESSASGRPLYLVEGEWIGEGADGEPTLDPRTIKVIGELDGKNVFNDYNSYAGFTYAGDKEVEHPHKKWIEGSSRFGAGGEVPENLFSEYGNLKKVNSNIQSRHPKLYVVQGRGYLYWHSDDSDLSLKLAGLYSTSIPIAKPSHQSIGTWLKEADEIMEQVGNSNKRHGSGGLSDDFGNSEKSSKFVHNITRNEIKNVISGKSSVRYGDAIQAISSFLRGNEGAGYEGKDPKLLKKQEAERLKQYIAHNNLWADIDFSSHYTRGGEQKISRFDEGNVVKANSALFYNYYWRDYFDSLLLHNLFFPDTAYEFIGFIEDEDGLLAVVKQPFVRETEKTDLDEVAKFMEQNGFSRIRGNDYENKQLGIILEDLHDENVLTKNGLLYFVDTVFFLNEDLKKSIYSSFASGGFAPAGFSELTFIHASDKKNRKSILENGLGASSNPVIVNGIYTFPEKWGHWGQETFGDKDRYYIKLKKDAKIFWTDADRPIDMEFGRGSSEFKKVYKDLIAKTGKTKKEIAYLQGEEWFEWKTQFSRLMEEYLRDNGYDAIQKGGEVVIVNLDAIQSVLLGNKTPVKLSSQKYHHRHESGGILPQQEENNLTTVTIRTANADELIMIEVSDYLPSSDVKNVVSGKYANWIEFQYKGERFERAIPESRAQNGLKRRVAGVRPVAAKCHVELLKNGKRFSKIGHSSHYLAHQEGEKWKALGMGNDYVVI